MIAPGQDARARWRAQCGSVHVVVEQAVVCERVDVGCLDRASVASQLPITRVVKNDEQHVGRPVSGAKWFGPSGRGYVKCAADNAGKCRSWFVFFKSHSFCSFYPGSILPRQLLMIVNVQFRSL